MLHCCVSTPSRNGLWAPVPSKNNVQKHVALGAAGVRASRAGVLCRSSILLDVDYSSVRNHFPRCLHAAQCARSVRAVRSVRNPRTAIRAMHARILTYRASKTLCASLACVGAFPGAAVGYGPFRRAGGFGSLAKLCISAPPQVTTGNGNGNGAVADELLQSIDLPELRDILNAVSNKLGRARPLAVGVS